MARKRPSPFGDRRLSIARIPLVAVPVLLALIALFAVGGYPGKIVVLALLPRLLRPREPRDGEPRWRPGVDALAALGCGLAMALVCQFALAPLVITGGETTASDAGEHFWNFHPMANPLWPDWNGNRYPLPVLLARFMAFSGNAYKTYYLAAVVSMGFVGAGLYLWGRAVGGVAAGLCTVVLACSVPDLVLMTRTVNSYPEVLAVWTVAAGVAAYALRYPHWTTALLAGIGCGMTFAADARGVIPGLLVLTVSLAAALAQRGGWLRGSLRRAIALALVIAPVALSYWLHAVLPIPLHTLEERIEGTVQASYFRVGEKPPSFVTPNEGYVWGRSNPLALPRTVRALQDASTRLNPNVVGSEEQRQMIALRVEPLLWPLGVLAVLGVLLGRGLPRWSERRDRAAWWRWLDPRGRLALLPVAASAIWLVNLMRYEYAERFMALAAPGFALLAGVGLAGLAGRGRPRWAAPALSLALVFVVPGALNVRADWRLPAVAEKELQQCIAHAKGEGQGPRSRNVDNCVRAAQQKVQPKIASPFWVREKKDPGKAPVGTGEVQKATW